mmetsp:Transcript_59561/g.158448  ORF Transcript_59561/g.158448 Transcript_59561/m.158448 type:complete len:269 (+) Transcript_59561:1293-2099(+)
MRQHQRLHQWSRDADFSHTTFIPSGHCDSAASQCFGARRCARHNDAVGLAHSWRRGTSPYRHSRSDKRRVPRFAGTCAQQQFCGCHRARPLGRLSHVSATGYPREKRCWDAVRRSEFCSLCAALQFQSLRSTVDRNSRRTNSYQCVWRTALPVRITWTRLCGGDAEFTSTLTCAVPRSWPRKKRCASAGLQTRRQRRESSSIRGVLHERDHDATVVVVSQWDQCLHCQRMRERLSQRLPKWSNDPQFSAPSRHEAVVRPGLQFAACKY